MDLKEILKSENFNFVNLQQEFSAASIEDITIAAYYFLQEEHSNRYAALHSTYVAFTAFLGELAEDVEFGGLTPKQVNIYNDLCVENEAVKELLAIEELENEYCEDVVDHAKNEIGEDETAEDLKYWIEANFLGYHNSPEDWAKEHIEETTGIPPALEDYIDFAGFAQDAEMNGSVTFVECSQGVAAFQ